MAEPNRKLLVCDLDNTLYDWVGYFVPSFYAMVDKVVAIARCDREKLLDGFREVHRKHHDSEHPFSLLEIGYLKDCFVGRSLAEIALELDPAFHAFNAERKARLRLSPGVREGLDQLISSGVTVVAHTESKFYAAVDRLKRLDLLDSFSRIYCRERTESVHPNPAVADNWLKNVPIAKFVELSHHQQKPNPDVLREICADEKVDRQKVVYIGDSIARDILMAKKAGVFSVWAKYGADHSPDDYAKLVRISHWTDEDVQKEKRLKIEAAEVKPDLVAEESFLEVLPTFGIRIPSLEFT